MKCKITDNGKLSIEFDIGSEEDIDAIVEEFDLAVKPSELRSLKNSLSAYIDVKNKVQMFLFDDETVKQPTIGVDEQTDGSDIVNTRAITLFSKLGYNVNDENVKILIDSFDELNRNKILSFASSTNPKMLLTFFNVFNYDSVIRIDENVIEVLDWVDLYQIEPVYKEHDDVQDVSWGVEKSAQLPTHEFAKVVDDGGEHVQKDN